MSLRFQIVTHIHEISAKSWNALNESHYPFISHEFLATLESSGCVGKESGWQPFHLTVFDADRLVACMPMYLKEHSYGEYVFDWSWAEAYQRYGLNYYPKLIAAIPYTPATGPRILLDSSLQLSQLLPELSDFLKNLQNKTEFSSIHFLFNHHALSEALTQTDFLQRRSVQFHWFNKGYENFDDFLAQFNSRKRKNLKKERRELTAQQVECIRLTGQQISTEDLDHFYHCYMQTYLKRSGHAGYLNHAFFKTLHQTMADNLMLVVAKKNEKRIAAALYVVGGNILYGRYWGAIEEINHLHFECCYYQGIEFAIEQHLTTFNPGTQGEHKIQRGFEPTFCYSNHWLARPEFQDAVANFLEQETLHIEAYHQDACQYLPFKQDI